MLLRRLSFLGTLSAFLITLAVGMLTTFMLFLWMHAHEQALEDFNFERRADAYVTAIRIGLDNSIQALEIVNQAFEAFEPVSEEQFHLFTQPMLASHPHVQAFGFQRLVSHAERPAFEVEMSKRHPGFSITEIVNGKPVTASVRDQYRVVQYVEPLKGNEIVLGLDVASYTSMHVDAIRRTLETGQASATGLFRLVQEPGSDLGFAVMMPVYHKETAHGDYRSRQKAAMGYTVAVFRAGHLVEKILTATNLIGIPSIGLKVYAAAGADDSNLVFRKQENAVDNGVLSRIGEWLLRSQPHNISSTFDVAGKPWHIVVQAQRVPYLNYHLGSFLALLTGTLFSFLAALYLHTLLLRSRSIRLLVEERTAELQLTNQRLLADIAARKQVEAALWKSQKSLRELSAYQHHIKESERKRIARELHDELGQNLLALRLDVAMLHTRTRTLPRLHAKIGAAMHQLDATMKSVRDIINDLRPTVLDLGLHAAIEWQVKQFQRRSGTPCELVIDHEEFALADEQSTALFRILQESLTNVMRHAHATRVRVELHKDGDKLCLKITDNGIGLPQHGQRKENAFGLVGIQERIHALGGTCAISSEPGRGTTIALTIAIEEVTDKQSQAVGKT